MTHYEEYPKITITKGENKMTHYEEYPKFMGIKFQLCRTSCGAEIKLGDRVSILPWLIFPSGNVAMEGRLYFPSESQLTFKLNKDVNPLVIIKKYNHYFSWRCSTRNNVGVALGTNNFLGLDFKFGVSYNIFSNGIKPFMGLEIEF